MNKTLEKMKNYLLNDSQSYVVKRTHLERPLLKIIGFLYCLSVFVLIFIATELVNFGAVLAPLDMLEPISKFFIDIETHEPRNILGWVYLIGIFIGVVISYFGMLIPGFYMIIKGTSLIDKEWPNDPEKTKKWRDKHVSK